MPDRPLISICIPSYNYARYLTQSLEGALAQTYPNTEVVVVDDCSTDDSMRVLERYRTHPRIRVYRNERNVGIAANHNVAAGKASGEFLAFPSADDMLLPAFVERTWAVFERFDGCGYDLGLVMADRDHLDADGLRTHFVPFYPGSFVCKGEKHARVAMMGNPGGPSQWLVKKRALLDVGGFDPVYGTAHDWEFMFKICCRYDFAYLDEKHCLYRWHQNLSARTIANLRYICNIHVMKVDMAARVATHPYLSQFARDAVRRTSSNAVNFAAECLRAGHDDAVRQHLLIAQALDPAAVTTPVFQAVALASEATPGARDRAVRALADLSSRAQPYAYPDEAERF